MESATAHGRAEVELGKFSFALKRVRKADFFPLENADVRAVFDCLAQGGWTLEVAVRAVYLATHELHAALELAEAVASGFGSVRGARVRRLDLCADFVGFPLKASDVERLVTTRARTATFIADAKDIGETDERFSGEALRLFRSKTRAVTGISVSPGNPLSARLYNKTKELSLPGRKAKLQIEEARWREHGWQGEPVTRFELQFRGEVLDELHLRDPDTLSERIDAAWKYGTQWVRLVDPTTAEKLSRCENDPCWKAVTAVVFVHEAAPASRERCRGGASVDHVIGAVRSRLASVGAISRIGEHVTEHGEVLDHNEYARRLSADEARLEVAAYVRGLCGKAADDIIASQALGLNWNHTLAGLLVRHDAAYARFASVADSPSSKAKVAS